MSGNFVSELIKAAIIDLLFKRPITLQYGRDQAGKVDFRAQINPSSGGGQQPQVMFMQPQQYGYAQPYPPAYPPGYPPAYPPAYPPGYPGQPSPPPGASGAPSQPPQEKVQTPFDLQIPTTFRR